MPSLHLNTNWYRQNDWRDYLSRDLRVANALHLVQTTPKFTPAYSDALDELKSSLVAPIKPPKRFFYAGG